MIELVSIGEEMPDSTLYINPRNLQPEIIRLIDYARRARDSAMPRFSHFSVGAALETNEGRFFLGSNEEASNGDTLCAERAALSAARQMVTPPKLVVRRIAIVGGPEEADTGSKILTPCGRCRQFLFDYEQRQGSQPIQVVCTSLSGPVRIFNQVNHVLLPTSFSER